MKAKKNWTCKTCNKKFYFYESGFFHNLIKHKNKGKIRYLFKFCALTRILKALFKGLLFVVWCVCFPFYMICEIVEQWIADIRV